MTTLYDLMRLESELQVLKAAARDLVLAVEQMQVTAPVSINVKVKTRKLKEMVS